MGLVVGFAFLGTSSVSQAQVTLTVGSGTSTYSYSPIYTLYSYNYSQQIYLASEITTAGASGPGFISKIRFKSMSAGISTSVFANWQVFLGNTAMSSFSSTTDWVPYAGLTEVFNGTFLPATTASDTWYEMTLATPYMWDGASNLVVAVHENSPSWTSTVSWASYTSTAGNRSMLFYTDSYDPSPSSPPSANVGPSSSIAQIQFEYTPAVACDGAVEAGVLTGMSVCPLNPFTVTNSGYTSASGISYLWEMRSPVGVGLWTPVAGATGPYYTSVTGISAETEYRLTMTCDSTGDTDMTDPVTVSISPAYECLCLPSCTYAGTNYTTLVQTSGAIINVDKSSGDYVTSLGYSDYRNTDSVMSAPGDLINFTVNTNPTGSNCNLGIWVDWNQNGVFEASEEVYSYLTSSGAMTFSGNFIVPITALSGRTVMRVRSGYYYSTYYTLSDVPPCGNIDWSEAEDYTFNVVYLDPCSSTVEAGTLAASEVCPSTSFTITNSGFTLASGFEVIWQKRSPSGTGLWTTIPGAIYASAYTEAAGITVPTDYRVILNCTASGATDTTAVLTVGISSFLDCYCIPTATYGCSYGSHVAGFETTGAAVNVSNPGTGCASGSLGYSDYFDSMQVTAVQLSTVTQATTVGLYSGGVHVWVDWNQNGIFESSELVANSGSIISGGMTYTSSFDVPLTATPGLTRMRVRVVESDADFDPCETSYYGETEDYGFMVVAAVSCSDPSIVFPTVANAVSSPAAVCGTGDVSLSIDTVMPLASAITYQWESAPTATGPWTAISTDAILPSFYYAGVSADTYFRCNIKCEGSNILYTNPVFVESVVPEMPTVFDGQICGPGEATLTGTVGTGFIFWFTDSTGGTPFATGDTVLTPSISTTTTFYAAGGAFPPALVQVGTSETSSGPYDPGPFNQYYRRYTMQLMYKKDQILASGGAAGIIDELRFNLTGLPTYGLPDYTISIMSVPESMTSLTWQSTGMTQVFGGTGFTFTPTAVGWQSFPFTSSFVWDGNSHIVVQVCWSQIPSYTAAGSHQYTSTTGQMLYNRTDASGTSCGTIGSTTSSYLPNVQFNFTGCATSRIPVTAYVREVPTINIDAEDGEYCLFNNEFFAGTSPAQPAGTSFIWNTGSTDTFLSASGAGVPTTYWVEVTNEWGCKNSDSLHVTLKPSPEVDLGDDILVCEGGVVTLDADGEAGDSYYWNTGETTETIVVDDGGAYAVLVTNEYGCMGTDTVLVTVEGFAPTVDGIIVANMGPNTFKFTPFHPMNVISYKWTFGDGSPSSMSMIPTHTYPGPGTYLVTLEAMSDCGKIEVFTYATIVQSIDEQELSENNLKLYPNPTNNFITVETTGDVEMNKISVVNILGQEVLSQDLNKEKSIKLDVTRLPSGMYTVKIDSNKGTLIKKFQVIK